MIINSTHPTFSTCNDVAKIAKPLKELGIIYFDYTRNEHNGGRIWLANHPSPTEIYLRKKYYLSGNMEASPTQYKPQIVFLDTLPQQHIYDDVLRPHNIDHSMQIINPHKDYCEFFGFATTKGNTKIINTYLTKIDVLKKFCAYFLEQAAPIIKLVEKNKVILPFHKKKIDFIDHDDTNSALYNILANRKSLSRRQLQCTKLLLAGNSICEIATTLSLSPRTIEHYLNNLKIKLKCKNKTELIIKLTNMLEE